jgi:ribosome-associated protein
VSLARLCATVLDEHKLSDIKILDVAGSLQIADCFVVASGRNARQIKAATDELLHRVRDEGVRRIGLEGYGEARWILVDFLDVVVHVFLEESRRYYDLESLWGDCPRVAWSGSDPDKKFVPDAAHRGSI